MNEINLTDVIKYLISKSVSIMLLTLTVSIITIIISLNLKEIYRSEALLGISQSELSSSSPALSGFEGIASLAGINLPGGNNPLMRSPDYVVAKINSRSFMRHLSSFPGITEGIVAAKSFNPETGQIIYDEELYDFVSKKWLREPKGFRESKPSYLEVQRVFLANLTVSFDRRTQFIAVSYDHSSPFFAKELVELIVKEVNNLQKKDDSTKSEKAMSYLTNLQSTNNIIQIERSLSALIENQIQKQMLASIEDEYLVEYIDEPFVPESRIYPKRTSLVVTTTILSFFIIIFIMLFYEFIVTKSFKNLN